MNATLDLLAETGYDGMTVEMVATRAQAGKATIYRRWLSKSDLVLNAITGMKPISVVIPDTGTLRGDLVGMIGPMHIRDGQRKIKIMAGLVGASARYPEMVSAARTALVEPREYVVHTVLKRAIERGEIPNNTDIETLSLIGASMVSYRLLILNRPIDPNFLVSVIDLIVVQARARTT